MPKKYRHHTQEFKLEAVKLLTQSGKSVVTIGRELGVDPSSLHRWRDELDPGHLMEPSGAVTKRKTKASVMVVSGEHGGSTND